MGTHKCRSAAVVGLRTLTLMARQAVPPPPAQVIAPLPPHPARCIHNPALSRRKHIGALPHSFKCLLTVNTAFSSLTRTCLFMTGTPYPGLDHPPPTPLFRPPSCSERPLT